MVKILISPSSKRVKALRRGGFTLIEILVAVAIMSLLLGVILVPLRLGFETYHIGKARAEVQQETQLTMQQIGIDLRRAKFIFPNSAIIGVSDNKDATSPCSTSPYKGLSTNWKFQPYIKSVNGGDTSSPYPFVSTLVKPNDAPPAYGVCSSATATPRVKAWSNPGRIDMLQVRRGDNGQDSTETQDFLISYYPRRLDISKPYDIVDNPVVLFRAQIPFRYTTGTASGNDFMVSNTPGAGYNADIDWTHYPDDIGVCMAVGPNPAPIPRSFVWITHNNYGEADLSELAKDAVATNGAIVAGAHTLATPLGMGLVAPRDINFGNSDPALAAGALVPELSFSEEATSGSRINRVTVSMTLAQYDQAGAGSVNGQGKAQRVHVSQTFDLPNAGCSP